MRLTKKSRQDVKYVKVLSERVVRPLLKKFMSGEITDEDIVNMTKKSLDRTIKKSLPTVKTISAIFVEKCPNQVSI